MPLDILILGPPGAGKGTQAKLISEEAGIPHVNTGDMYRAAAAAGNELGKRVKPYMDAGELVPDDLTIDVVRERLSQPDTMDGFVLDGFPRTLPQAEALDAILGGLTGGGAAQSRGGLGMGAQSQNPLLQIALQMLQQNGGLQGILGKFQQAGYGEQAQSWIGTGNNLPIDPGALSQIFGGGQLGQIAQQLGVSQDEAAGQLADALPNVVDRMTPNGEISAGHDDLVNQVLAQLQRR